jgi:hypothetical protein
LRIEALGDSEIEEFRNLEIGGLRNAGIKRGSFTQNSFELKLCKNACMLSKT